MSCGHIDYPCCGCGNYLEHFDDGDLCQGCGEPENYCVCDRQVDGGESMDGDHENALASAGFGTDEDYMSGGYDDIGGDW